MATRVGINGFGRIGRQSFKAILDYYPDELEVVAVNDLMDTKTNAHLLRHDSNYGAFPGTVEVKGDSLVVNGKGVRVLCERDPSKLPWKDLGVDIVIESTGVFRDATKAAMHREAGAKKVIIQYRRSRAEMPALDAEIEDAIEEGIERNAKKIIIRRDMQNRKRYTLKDGSEIEIVKPNHNPSFCQACTRIRLTSDGKLKPCIMRNDNLTDILTPLRRGASNQELKRIFITAIKRREPYWKKRDTHSNSSI